MGKIFGYKQFHFDFLGKKKICYIIALAIIIPGLVVLAINGFNLGLDFTGGTILEVDIAGDPELADVRAIVEDNMTQTPFVNLTDAGTFSIRTSELTMEEMGQIEDALSVLGEVTVVSSETIGPVIGSELLKNARLALLIAGILMLLYITIRFKFNYAVTAIVALAHDVLVTISIFAIFRIEVNSYFIAAILTIIGYSINNTIVVYDRIRENSGLMDKRDIRSIINNSINQTLTRNINTILAVVILLACLIIFGGSTTRSFIVAMLVGVLAGFYSSAFIVGSFLENMCEWTKTRLSGEKIYRNMPSKSGGKSTNKATASAKQLSQQKAKEDAKDAIDTDLIREIEADAAAEKQQLQAAAKSAKKTVKKSSGKSRKSH